MKWIFVNGKCRTIKQFSIYWVYFLELTFAHYRLNHFLYDVYWSNSFMNANFIATFRKIFRKISNQNFIFEIAGQEHFCQKFPYVKEAYENSYPRQLISFGECWHGGKTDNIINVDGRYPWFVRIIIGEVLCDTLN